jgi:aminopeptidase N
MSFCHKLSFGFMRVSVFVVSCFIVNFASAQPENLSYITSGGKLKPLQAIMDIRHYSLSINLDIPSKSFEASNEIKVSMSRPSDTFLFDLVHVLKITSVSVDGQSAKFSQKQDEVFVTGKRFNAGTHLILIKYGGVPPVAVKPPWDGGFTWTKDTNGNPWIAINCQMEGGKIYFPCKDHPSDEPNEGVDLFVTVPTGLLVAAPGLLKKVTPRHNNTSTFHWKTEYPISNYCVVFNVAKYKIASRDYTTVTGKKVPMQFYVLEADSARASEVLDIRERDAHILEKYFGEYPWVKEKMGIAFVPNPGMEHQTMISYGDRFYFRKIGSSIYSDNLFHEFAHEWWANKVTNTDWAHMWIQEGIATYAEALCHEDLAGETAYRKTIASFKKSIANKKPLVPGESASTGDVYNGDIYVKGAFFMHMLRYMMGDSLFFPTIKHLATDTATTCNHFVSSHDVEQLFTRNYKSDLKPFFDLFLKTTNYLSFQVTQTGADSYHLALVNCAVSLPVAITTSTGKQLLTLTAQGVDFKSTSKPIVDEDNNYLKDVVYQEKQP